MIYFDHAATSLPKSKIALEAFLNVANNYANAFKMGIAAGSASAFSDNLATKDEVDNLFDRIEIEQAD